MSRSLAPFLVFVLITSTIHPAHAQGDIRLGLGGGVSLPLRSYADAVKTGWLGQGNLAFFPGASTSIGFRIDGFYGRNVLKATPGRTSMLGSTASLVLQVGSRRSPNRIYLFGGGGYVRTRTTGPNFGSLSSTNPAITGGAGVSFGSRSFALFVEGRYLSVYTDGIKPQLAPIVAGFSFGGL
ncbi:MAG: hypothetical protein SGJ01_16530 [Gemmatimonadota bacterium]|nr:hypothetical protein [Gemmatimonadota bacterium]